MRTVRSMTARGESKSAGMAAPSPDPLLRSNAGIFNDNGGLMKTNAKKRSVLLGTLGIILLAGFIACKKKDNAATADAGGSVATKQDQLTITSSVVKFSEVRASVNTDCSKAVTVGVPTGSPTNAGASGFIPDGVYHCLMFHISDQVPVTPPPASGCGFATVDI